MNWITILALMCIAVSACSAGGSFEVPETANEVHVVLVLNPELGNGNLELEFPAEGTRRVLLNRLRGSRRVLNPAKCALLEGRYEIRFTATQTSYVIELSCTEDFYVVNEERYYRNPELIDFVRELLFFTMIEKGMKLR